MQAVEEMSRQKMEIEPFRYMALPGAPEELLLEAFHEEANEDEAEESALSEPELEHSSPSLAEERLRAEYEHRLGEETRRAFDAGKQKGIEEGRVAEREIQNALRAQSEQDKQRQLAGLVDQFARARDQYLHAVEREVVALALSIASRILRREAQMDPLLLTGAVRVALGQLSGSTQIRLKVPPAEVDLWKESIKLLPNLAVKPEVVEGEGMRLGDCMVETQFGSVDLGVRAQLNEIERGFFDRTRSGVKTTEPVSEHGEVRA